jgi:hypothetical protein
MGVCSVKPAYRDSLSCLGLEVAVSGRSCRGGLLDRSTARYFYKRLKTSLHKPTGNFLENLFSRKCAFKNNLQLLEAKFLSQTNSNLKMAFYLTKSSIYQYLIVKNRSLSNKVFIYYLNINFFFCTWVSTANSLYFYKAKNCRVVDLSSHSPAELSPWLPSGCYWLSPVVDPEVTTTCQWDSRWVLLTISLDMKQLY